MAKRWIYTVTFSYAGDNYITWMRPTFMNEDHSWNWEHKTKKATDLDIDKAEEENNLYFTSFKKK